MVRLAILALVLVVSGCAQRPLQPELIEQQELPKTQIQRLDEGQHSPVVAALLAQAEERRQQYRLQVAAGLLDQARQVEPRNAEILYRQAWLALQRNQATEAENLARRGLIFAGSNPLVKYRLQDLLADSLEQQGRAMEAMVLRAQITEH